MKLRSKKEIPILFIALTAALLLATFTYAWLMKGAKLDADNMQMKIINDTLEIVETEEEDFVLVDEDGFVDRNEEHIANALSVPDDKARFRVLLKNTSEEAVAFDEIGFSKPKVLEPNATPEEGVYYDEIPKDGYYFGTQLKVKLVGLYTGTVSQLETGIGEGAKTLYERGVEADIVDSSIAGVSVGDGALLLTYKDPANIGSGVNASKIPLSTFGVNKLQLQPDECIAIYIEVEFVESGEPQDAYRLFGKENTGEACRRSVYVILNKE